MAAIEVNLRRAMTASVVALLFCGSSAFANAAVRCVQHQLTDLSYAPGPIDGQLGPATKRAARRALTEHPLRHKLDSLPRLNRGSALSWCWQLSGLGAELGQYRPALKGLEINVDDTAGPEQRAMMYSTIANVTEFFRSKYDIRLAGTIGWSGGEPAVLRSFAVAYERARKRNLSNLDSWLEKGCTSSGSLGGVAYSNLVFLCWTPAENYGAGWRRLTESRLELIVAHEFMHLVQSELGNQIVPQRQRTKFRLNMGPNWMVEGSAVVIERQFQASQLARRLRPIEMTRIGTRYKTVPLSALRPHRSVFEKKGYPVAHFAAAILAERFGTQSLFDYFRVIGRGESWETAFLETFGMHLKEYEAEFEELRKSASATRAFVTADGTLPPTKRGLSRLAKRRLGIPETSAR